jgi:predicted DNA-binding transcriptional regulator YafY
MAPYVIIKMQYSNDPRESSSEATLMRADRLLSILLLLQARGRLTGRELAEHLEVSPRTLHRDMESLSAAGVPVFALRGARGGWQLDEHWRTQVPALDEAELRALLMAQPRLIGDSRLARAAERALGKLMAAMPVSLRAQAASIRQRLYVDATGWRAATEDLSQLELVQDAVSRDRKLAIQYRGARHKGGEKTAAASQERIIDPLGLVAKGSAWYLVAGTPKGFRTFRVSRIEKATLLEQASQRPSDFDLAAHWKSSTQQFAEGWPRCHATLRLAPRTAEWVRLWRIATPAEVQTPDPEGWVRLRVQFDHPDEARFIVLGLGPQVDVIEPESLRRQVATDVAAAAQRWLKAMRSDSEQD